MEFFDSLNADETARRHKAREAIAAGVLPNRAPARTWGGKGVGAQCTICGEAITTQEIEFELEFGVDPPVREHYRLHMRCFAAWEFERASMSGTRHPIAAPEALKAPNGDVTMRARERSTDTSRGIP
jgi:hypothetical protein